MSALHAAARDGNYATAEDLVNHGTNVNQLDERRYTPLHYAARSGIVRVCQLLLDARGGRLGAELEGPEPAVPGKYGQPRVCVQPLRTALPNVCAVFRLALLSSSRGTVAKNNAPPPPHTHTRARALALSLSFCHSPCWFCFFLPRVCCSLSGACRLSISRFVFLAPTCALHVAALRRPLVYTCWPQAVAGGHVEAVRLLVGTALSCVPWYGIVDTTCSAVLCATRTTCRTRFTCACAVHVQYLCQCWHLPVRHRACTTGLRLGIPFSPPDPKVTISSPTTLSSHYAQFSSVHVGLRCGDTTDAHTPVAATRLRNVIV